VGIVTGSTLTGEPPHGELMAEDGAGLPPLLLLVALHESSSFTSLAFSWTRTNLPFMRGRSSASFFRQSYLMLFFHVRFFRFSWNFWMRSRRASGEYEPIFRCASTL
jgi:hypothetical protein